MATDYLHITGGEKWSGPHAPAMLQSMKRFVRKYNGHIAVLMSLVLIVAGSLQLVHDHLIDHEHTAECAIYMVDGKQPLAQQSQACLAHKQLVESTPYTPTQFVLSFLYKNQPRAPPQS